MREFFMRVVGQRSVKKLGKPSIDFRRLLSVSHKKVSQKISIYKHLQFFFAAHPNASSVRRILLHGSIRIKWNAGNCKFADIF